MKRLFTLYILLTFSSIYAQNVTWFPDKINIQPFTANFLEPKLGFAFHTGSDNLRLDISNSRDIYLKENLNSCNGKAVHSSFSLGADLFTFTRLRRESDFHFPVETIDYLFGFNGGYKVVVGEKQPVSDKVQDNDRFLLEPRPSKIYYEYGIRFRLSHISAHLVDGKYDFQLNGWRDSDHPRVYSREFIELFPYFKIRDIRVYAGLTYLIHVTPKDLGKDIYQLGFDYFASDFLGNMVTPFVAYDFKLSHLYKYSGNNTISAGIKFGNSRGTGCSLLYSFISGKSIHGEYFDRNESYSTIGLNIDL